MLDCTRAFFLVSVLILGALPCTAPRAHQEGGVHEHCPSVADVGDNVECYPLTINAKSEVHPAGIPIIAYLFVPKSRSGTELPAIIFAHGCSGMYSSGVHNKGLSSKHRQWVRHYTNGDMATNGAGYVGLHISSFHSRYLLPDTAGSQDLGGSPPMVPASEPGGDDYHREREGTAGSDPNVDEWKECGNGNNGVSETLERPYDMDAGYDFLIGTLTATLIADSEGETLANGSGASTFGSIDDLVNGDLAIDINRVFGYGTSHGGQTAISTAHESHLDGTTNPMGGVRRFAAWFDFYGGCGLFSAYGSSDSSSTWRPYPDGFLMLHGEADPIWKEATAATTREEWNHGECQPRIDAAFADPDFAGGLVNAVIYKNARHSFDGVDIDDANPADLDDPDTIDWITKVHADRLVQAFIAARDAGAPEDAGFSETAPFFASIPFDAALAPEFDGVAVQITNPGSASVDLAAKFTEPFGIFPIQFSILDAPPMNTRAFFPPDTVSVTGSSLEIALRPEQMDADQHFGIVAETPKGKTIVPAILRIHDDGTATLRFEPAYSVQHQSEFLLENSDGPALDLTAFVNSPTAWSAGSTEFVAASSEFPDGVSLADGKLVFDHFTPPIDAAVVDVRAISGDTELFFGLTLTGDTQTVRAKLLEVSHLGSAVLDLAFPQERNTPDASSSDGGTETGTAESAAPETSHGGGGALLWLILLFLPVPGRQRR